MDLTGVNVTFDGWLFDTDDGRVIQGASNPDLHPNGDFLNTDTLGFGVRDGAIDTNEGWTMTLDQLVEGMQFEIDHQGDIEDVVFAIDINSGGEFGTVVDFVTATESNGGNLMFADTGDAFWIYTEVPDQQNVDITVTILDQSVAGSYIMGSNEILIEVDGQFDWAQFQVTYLQDPEEGQDIDFTAPFENDSIRVQTFQVIE